jgi:hypothetical protein
LFIEFHTGSTGIGALFQIVKSLFCGFMEEERLVTPHERIKSLFDVADRVEIDERIPPEKCVLLSLLI